MGMESKTWKAWHGRHGRHGRPRYGGNGRWEKPGGGVLRALGAAPGIRSGCAVSSVGGAVARRAGDAALDGKVGGGVERAITGEWCDRRMTRSGRRCSGVGS